MNEPMTLLYIVCANDDEAATIARVLLDVRLVACVNIHPISSLYWWQGEIQNDREVVVLAKTLARPTLLAAIEQMVRRLHSYEIPSIMQLPVLAVNEDYYAWLVEQVRAED